MHGSNFLKILGVVLVVLVIGLVQVSFSVLEINKIIPNLVLILVFGISFWEMRSSSQLGWRSFSVAVAGGLLLDIFSSLPLGSEALMLAIMVLMIEQAFKFLDKTNYLVYAVLFLLLLVLYQIIFNFLSFGKFTLNWLALIYNFSLASLFYLICSLGRILREK